MAKEIPSVLWSDHSGDWDLQPDQVDIWRIFLDASTLPAVVSTSLSTDPVKSFESILSADENQRAAKFVFPRDRNRFILSHGHVRLILARYLGCDPDQLNFSTNEYGKPELQGHSLEFNLSHSGDFALLAVSHHHKVGIDVERVRQDTELENLARRFFSGREYSELMAIPQDQRSAAFFRCWTLKEAYIKAQGLGLSLPLDSFDVALAPDKQPVLRATRPNPNEAPQWSLLSFEVDPEHAGAVAVKSTNPEIKYWNWKSSQKAP